MPLLLEQPLAKKVSLSVHRSHAGALLGNAKAGTFELRSGCSTPLFVAPLSASAVPKGASPGDVLVGSLTLGKGIDDAVGASCRPGGFPLAAVVPPAAPKPATGPKAPNAVAPGALEGEEKELLALRLKRLAALEGKPGFMAEHARLLELYSGSVGSDAGCLISIDLAQSLLADAVASKRPEGRCAASNLLFCACARCWCNPVISHFVYVTSLHSTSARISRIVFPAKLQQL